MRAHLLLVLGCAVVLGGCQCVSVPENVRFACDSAGDCLAGERCVDRACVSDVTDSGTPDAGCVSGARCTGNPTPCLLGVSTCEPVGCVDSLDPSDAGLSCDGGTCDGTGQCVSCGGGEACANPPDRACHFGITECSGGSIRCADGAAKPDGTACGPDQVCRDGGCAACVSGATCATNPGHPCFVGVTTCGAETGCEDGVPSAAGTSCGMNFVCTGTGGCMFCQAGLGCATNPGAPCIEGRIACNSGAPTCVDTGPKPVGSACGAGRVCNASAQCVACASGQSCGTNPSECRFGQTSCSTGASTCLDLGPKDAGTACSGAQICDGQGFCGACVAGNACAGNSDPCRVGVTACGDGGLGTSCVNGAPRAVGSSCGAGSVCNASGQCVPCSDGAGCTTNPNACANGRVSCTTGAPVCGDGTTLPAGTACGSNQVCTAGGQCMTCVPNQPCSGNPSSCRTGATSCASGASICVDSGNRSAGSSCGTNQVCDGAGACVACTAGASCTTNPNAGCFNGVISCASGAQVCVDGTQKATGTSCGTNQVCSATGSCVACTAGQACTSNPGAACFDGVTSCASGAQTCVNGAAKAAGTSCGANQVCNGSGTCVACSAGQACTTNPSACRNGVTSCSTGAQTCVDGSPKTAGTDCGSGRVCDGVGNCGACTAGQACTGNPGVCFNGVTSCTTGTAVCVDGAAKATGTSCGTNQVCNATQQCIACTTGAACSTNPNMACKNGTTACGSGAPVCNDASDKPNGTSCGTNQVCNAGTCAACTVGQACSGNPNPCRDGTTSCATGTPVCVDGATLRPAGTSCGTNQVCSSSGTCAACTVGAACTSNPNPCFNGTTQCSSGAPVCVNSTQKAAGTTCGANQVCNSSGSCVTCASGNQCVNNPSPQCSEGVISCTTGAPVCIDGAPQPIGTPCGSGAICDGSGSCGSDVCNYGCINTFGGCQSGDSATDCGGGGAACANCTQGLLNCICNVNTRQCTDLESGQMCGPRN